MALSVLTTPRFDFEQASAVAELAFSQAVNAVVFNNVRHLNAAAQRMRELTETRVKTEIAITGNAER